MILSPVISAAMISGINDISKLIPEEKTLVTGYIYFGKYTFVINGAFPTIDVRDCPTPSLKKLKTTVPLNRYTG